MNHFQLIKRTILVLSIFIIWSELNSLLIYGLITHHLRWVNPFLYLFAAPAIYAEERGGQYLLISMIVSSMVLLILYLLTSKSSIPNLYGKAQFATLRDIKKAGLLAKDGILLGSYQNNYLKLASDEHICVFAPTGSGKTSSITIPNLLEWKDSCVVSDIKLSLFQTTSKYRKAIGQDVYLWNPASPTGETHCYNPLDLVKDNSITRVDELQQQAAIFIPNKDNEDPIWPVQSRLLFIAFALYVMDTTELPVTIATIVQLIKSQTNLVAFIYDILQNREDLDPVCRFNLNQFVALPDKTRGSVITSFLSYFELFDNPLIAVATSRSDFNIADLRRKRMTIFVGITNDNLVRLSPLITVFYQQVTNTLTKRLPVSDEIYRVLFLMDEFTTLRKMESFHKNIGLYREYHLRIVIIIQELSQLYEIYGRDGAKVFINSKVRVAFTQNDEETSRYIESLLGKQTLLIKHQSKKLMTGLLTKSDVNESEHYYARPLMLAQEIRQMPMNKALVLVEGKLPIYANKVRWFADNNFKHKEVGAIEMKTILVEVERYMKKVKEDLYKNNISIKTPNEENDDALFDQSL